MSLKSVDTTGSNILRGSRTAHSGPGVGPVAPTPIGAAKGTLLESEELVTTDGVLALRTPP